MAQELTARLGTSLAQLGQIRLAVSGDVPAAPVVPLGAPITLRAVGAHTAAAAAVTPLAPGLPAGVTTADLSILTVEGKRAAGATAPTVTTPTGWTLLAATHSTTALTPANDTGTNSVFTYWRTGTYTAPSITTTGFNAAGAVIVAYQTTGNGWVTPPVSTSGSDTTSAANGAITGAADLSVMTQDLVHVSAGLSGDLGTVSAQTIAGMSSATLSATTERVNFAVTTGTDARTCVADCTVTAGSSSAVPTYAYTNASALTSHAQFIRLRANDPLPTPLMETLTESFTAVPSSSVWNYYDGAWHSIVNGQLNVTGNGSVFPTLQTDVGYNLTNSYVHVEIVQHSNLDQSATFQLADLASSNRIEMIRSSNTNRVYLREYNNTGPVYAESDVAFDATAMRWWRIRHVGTNLLWDTSPDGITWNNQRTATRTIPINSLYVTLIIGGAIIGGGAAGTTIFDNLNLSPSVNLAPRRRIGRRTF